MPYPTVKKLTKAHNFPSLTETQLKEKLSVSKKCANLQEYLKKFDLLPSFTLKKLTQEGAVKACISGLEKFYKWQDEQQDNSYSLYANLILCLMRLPNREHENNLTVKLAAEYVRRHVVGIDLAGPEGPIPNKEFSSFFEDEKTMHIPFTIHPGEAAGPDQCRKP